MECLCVTGSKKTNPFPEILIEEEAVAGGLLQLELSSALYCGNHALLACCYLFFMHHTLQAFVPFSVLWRIW